MPNIRRMQQILRNEHARRVHVQLPGIDFEVRPAVFQEVAGRLVLPNAHVAGTIAVVVDARLGNFAQYRFRINELAVSGEGFPSTQFQESLLIHEAVHAYHDLRGFRLQWDTDEMLAYVAQMAYLLRRDPTLLRGLSALQSNMPDANQQCLNQAGVGALGQAHPCDRPIVGWALLIALRLRSGQPPTPVQVQGLRLSLLRHPSYGGLLGVDARGRANVRQFDGI